MKKEVESKEVLTVDHLVAASDVNTILSEISEAEVDDIAVIFRTSDGVIHSRWYGDSLALVTASNILTEDIRMSINTFEESYDDEDTEESLQ